MTNPDFHGLISQMADELDHCQQLLMDDRRQRHPLADRARALLAEPEAEGPTIGDVMQLWASTPHIDEAEGAIAFARAVPARWGRPAAAPVPVSERLPGPEDCDDQGRCWMFGKVEGDWRLISRIDPGIPKLRYCFSHWLPANALPLPAPEVQL